MTYMEGDLLLIVAGNTDDPECPLDSTDWHSFSMGSLVTVIRHDTNDNTFLCAGSILDENGLAFPTEQWVQEDHVVPAPTVDTTSLDSIEKFLSETPTDPRRGPE